MRLARVVAIVASSAPLRAFAHGVAANPDGSPSAFEAALVVSLVVLGVLYAVGAIKIRRKHRAGAASHAFRHWCFAAGWTTLAAATLSPLHELGERSFSLHMIEHELLMLVAAPLLALSHPFGMTVWGLSRPLRKAIGRMRNADWVKASLQFLFAPVAATLVQAAALWIWHAPGLFDLALGHESWHVAQHLSLLLTSLIFWLAMLSHRRAQGVGLVAVCLFATSIVTGALGALMSFSDSPWYARYALLGMTPQGMTPTEDQQLAGLLMWIPGGVVHAVAALVMVGKALAIRPSPVTEPR